MTYLCNHYVMAIRYRKESIHATVSPYIKKQAEELVATEEFSSMSDLVSIALAEFIGRYKREQKAIRTKCEEETIKIVHEID